MPICAKRQRMMECSGDSVLPIKKAKNPQTPTAKLNNAHTQSNLLLREHSIMILKIKHVTKRKRPPKENISLCIVIGASNRNR